MHKMINQHKAKQLTMAQHSLWLESPYARFLQYCNKDELLQSQIPFYDAVEAFPQLLLKLASMLTDADARFFIVENIWQEHGQGDKEQFHTESFKRHLNSLGFDGLFFKNPFVTKWLDSLFAIQCPKVLFHTLSAIEYIYALISESMAQTLQDMRLLSKPEHYKTHSVIDWTHGEELLISMSLSNIDFNESLFIQAQHEFINLFSQLALITSKELTQFINDEPISFVHTRESTNVIDHALSSIAADNIQVLCICSGGENPIYYAAQDKVDHVLAFDMNPAQLQVCQNKMSACFDYDSQGRFEFLFTRVRRYFIQVDGTNTIVSDYEINSNLLSWAIEQSFTDQVLSTLFTDDAIKYTKQSFSEHFKKVYFGMCKQALTGELNANSKNILFSEPITIAKKHAQIALNKVELAHMDAPQALTKGKFDVIDLSNIGDWMPSIQFKHVLVKACSALKPNGQLILRRLLGDYCLTEQGLVSVERLIDDTGFYTETVIVKNESLSNQ